MILVASRSRELRVLVQWGLPVAVLATIVIPASRIVLHIFQAQPRLSARKFGVHAHDNIIIKNQHAIIII